MLEKRPVQVFLQNFQRPCKSEKNHISLPTKKKTKHKFYGYLFHILDFSKVLVLLASERPMRGTLCVNAAHCLVRVNRKDNIFTTISGLVYLLHCPKKQHRS